MFTIVINSTDFQNGTPIFRANETAVIDIKIQNPNGTPYDITGKAFNLVLDCDFNAKNTPLATSSSEMPIDTENAVIRFLVPCHGDKIQQLTAIKRNRAVIEINEFTPDNTAGRVIFQSTPIDCLRPRIYNPEAGNNPQSGGTGTPQAIDLSNYVTKPELQETAENIVHEVSQFTEALSTELESFNLDQFATKQELETELQNVPRLDDFGKLPVEIIPATYVNLPVPSCKELGIVLNPDDNSEMLLSWKDPDPGTIEGNEISWWEKTVLVRKEGAYPDNHTDGAVIAETSILLNNKNAYQTNFFTDNQREAGKEYFYKLFSCSTTGTWNNLQGNQFDEENGMTWAMIRNFVKAGKGAEMFPVGTVFTVEHSEYIHSNGDGIYFRVVGHDQMEAEDPTIEHTMALDMVECLLSACFDNKELLYALTEDITAQAGKAYYVRNEDVYTQLTAGTDYQIGDNVPDGEWFEKNLNDHTNGSNNPVECNLINWANADGQKYQWFKKMNLFDQCSSELLSRNGFLKFIDKDFLSTVQNAKIISMLKNIEGGKSVTHFAKFFPLSSAQVNYTNTGENTKFSFFTNDASRIKKQLNTNTAVKWHLRSNLKTVNTIYAVQANGSITTNQSLFNANYVSLACIIG